MAGSPSLRKNTKVWASKAHIFRKMPINAADHLCGVWCLMAKKAVQTGGLLAAINVLGFTPVLSSFSMGYQHKRTLEWRKDCIWYLMAS